MRATAIAVNTSASSVAKQFQRVLLLSARSVTPRLNFGQFASDSSPEWAEFANDLGFEALATSRQEAGYEVLEYSAQCDHGDHGHCTGKNRISEEIPPHLDWLNRCFCECHRGDVPSYGERLAGNRKASADDTVL